MDTFLELQTAVLSDLNINEGSTMFPTATIKLAINRAYKKAGGLYRWPETEDAQKTSTQANQEYYDYPSNWRPDSAWKLTVDDEDYADPLDFKDYLYEKENGIPSGADFLWSTQWRRYFIYPTPTIAGNYNISIWGVKVVDSLVNDSDPTIFSYAMQECNDAIVMEACAILRAKAEEQNASMFKSAESKQILTIAWNKIRQEKSKNQKTTPFLKVSDMFGSTQTEDIIGNF